MKIPVVTYLSPKVKKIRQSDIAGRGLVSTDSIAKGEIVAIKGGHIIDLKIFEEKYEPIVGMSALQIDDNFVIAPLEKDEIENTVMFLNHSCNPNVGLRGEITFVAMRDISTGEEIVTDYAMIQNNTDGSMECNCNTKDCRKIITGKDWERKDLQKKYGRYFSAFLRNKFE
jgi:SET domain-containing protein